MTAAARAVGLPDRGARREALLDAAERAVRAEGPATSMAAVAAEAGISKPILYRHFGDKGGLVAALAERHTARLMTALREALRTAVRTGRGRRQRVEQMVGAYLREIEAAPELYRFLLRPEGVGEPEQVRRFVRRLGEVLADGIATEVGAGAAGCREQAWAHGIVGMVQGAGDWWLDTAPCPREELAAQLADLLLGAYAAAPGG